MTRRFAPAGGFAGPLTLLVVASVILAGGAVAKEDPAPLAGRTVLFASDGMRPDLMEKYAAQGAMPTYSTLMAEGVRGSNGLVQAFPPNTGVGWYTLATGTYPGEHGSTNNTYHRTGESNFNNRTSFSLTGTLQADTIAAAAERAGKKVAQIDWVGGANAGISGPTVDFTNFFSTRGVLAAPLNAGEQSGAAAFGISYQVASFAPAAGWSNVPAGDPAAPPMQTQLTVATSFGAQNPTRIYDIYIYDSVVNGAPAYNHAIMVRSGALKDGNQKAVDLAVGDFKEIKLKGADGLIGTRAGQTAGFYAKLISLAPDLSSFKLYFTSVERVIATCGTPACAALAGGNLENYLADNFPTFIAADFAPLEARIIDEETYVQQGRDLEAAYGDAVLEFILGTLQPDTDLALVGYPVTDEFAHQFMALYTPTDMDGAPNPYFDNVDGVGPPDGLTAVREGFVRSAYHGADEKLALARELMGGKPTTFASSDHGFAPQWYAVNVSKILFDLGFGPEQTSNCRAVAATLAKECHAGGTAQIYLDVAGRDPATATPPAPAPPIDNRPQIPAADYEAKRDLIINAFKNLTDPANPGKKVVEAVFKKEQLRNVDGSDSLHPNRSGDVVVVFRPPYQTDAATPGQLVAFSQFFGQHGYLPDLVDLEHNVNMHATFVAAGPGIRKQGPVGGVRAVDLAPTLAFLMDIPGPLNARGKILYGLTNGQGKYKEITFLDISDYHGQLVPLAEAADTFGPSFPIGGAAFLKPWFDVYRAEAEDDNFTVAAGDSVGATPPISSFFGDTPTIELMNMMGFTADGLGNHNFDKGQAYLRNTLIPLAKFPYVSSNVVGANGKTPAEWKPSLTFNVEGGKLGLVGFTNEDAPTLVFPNSFNPFSVVPRIPRVQAEVNALRAKGAKVIVVIGHDGATAGTLTAPTGPLVDLADALTGVDAVIGDHTDFQVLATRTNGTLVVENRSKGIRFTRVRLVLDTSTGGVIYRTADFHKPWDIGITPDAAIQARIDQLTAQLAPILGIVIGSSNVEILRSDACGQSAGRTCESKVGNAVTDALRLTYGTEFALTNSGGLRDRLTCPQAGGGPGFCPVFTPPPYLITRGQVLTVLPFGNVAVTLTVTGAELKSMLERGVSAMPAADGRFPQISGLCFTYDIAAPSSSRVTGAVRQAADGSCTGSAINLAGGSYTLTSNDFTASGGDGYPSFVGRFTTRDIMDQAVADFIDARTPPGIGPTIQGRIACTDSNGATAPNCPVVVP